MGRKEMQIQKPVIKYQLRGLRKVRKGRGYSKVELRQAGLQSVNIARLNEIPIDIRRKTSYQENVEYLRPFISEILNSRADRKNNSTISSSKREDQQQKADKGGKKKKVSSRKKRKEKDINE
jgi:ribosomal protein L13E